MLLLAAWQMNRVSRSALLTLDSRRVFTTRPGNLMENLVTSLLRLCNVSVLLSTADEQRAQRTLRTMFTFVIAINLEQ